MEDIASMGVRTERFQLRRICFGISVENIEPENVEFRQRQSAHARERLVFEMDGFFAAKKLPDLRYPDGWWEAVKERWFSGWLKKQYPVRWKKYEVTAYLPKFPVKHYRDRGVYDIRVVAAQPEFVWGSE